MLHKFGFGQFGRAAGAGTRLKEPVAKQLI
jgi:hypothetical protein